MCISFLLISIVDKTLNVHIRSSLHVFHWYASALEYCKTNLKLVVRFLLNVPHFTNIRGFARRIDVKPHIDNTLIQLATHVVQLSRFNRLLIDRLPFRVEKPIVQIYGGFSNEIISEKHIIVIGFNN